MKYLIKHKKEFAISVGVFVMTIINLIKAIKTGDLSEDVIVAFVLALFTIMGWYYNNPTSIEGEISKIEIKQRKACRNVAYNPAPEPEDAEVKE